MHQCGSKSRIQQLSLPFTLPGCGAAMPTLTDLEQRFRRVCRDCRGLWKWTVHHLNGRVLIVVQKQWYPSVIVMHFLRNHRRDVIGGISGKREIPLPWVLEPCCSFGYVCACTFCLLICLEKERYKQRQRGSIHRGAACVCGACSSKAARIISSNLYNILSVQELTYLLRAATLAWTSPGVGLNATQFCSLIPRESSLCLAAKCFGRSPSSGRRQKKTVLTSVTSYMVRKGWGESMLRGGYRVENLHCVCRFVQSSQETRWAERLRLRPDDRRMVNLSKCHWARLWSPTLTSACECAVSWLPRYYHPCVNGLMWQML